MAAQAAKAKSDCMVTPVETFAVMMREAGITLVLLWVLTLAIVWGLLSHANMPKSGAVRGVIALAAAFLVLLAAAASPAVAFLQNLITAGILIAFGLLVAVVFLEILGIKAGEQFFGKYSAFFGILILLLLVAIFIGAGGLGIVGLPKIALDQGVVAFLIFGIVIIAAVGIMMKEVGGKKE